MTTHTVTSPEVWRILINDFNPVGPVSPDDVRDVFVDRSDGHPSRSVLNRLSTSLRNNVGQKTRYKGLLTGYVGCGKTSELMRLAQSLAGEYFVVWFDAESSLSQEKANHFDVLLAMGVSIHAAADAIGLKPDRALAESFVNGFATFVRKYEDKKKFALKLDQVLKQVFTIALTVAGAASGNPIAAVMAGAAAATVGDAFKATALELNVNDNLVRTLELPANRQEIIGRLNQIIQDVQERAGRPLLVITDGLDKVTAIRARLLFAESSLLAEPACALVYAAPIEFYHRLSSGVTASVFADYAFLGNPAVYRSPVGGWRVERESDEEGRKIIHAIISRRIERRGFEVSAVIEPRALDSIAGASGGIVRDAIRFMRDAAISAQIEGARKITASLADAVIDGQRQEMAVRLSASHREALTRVLESAALIGGPNEGIEDELLHAAYLLSYQGDRGKSWFDAHPNTLYVLRS